MTGSDRELTPHQASTYQTKNMLLAPANGTIGGNTMNHNFQTEYAKNYSVSVQRELTPRTVVDVSFLRSTITGADSSTVLNVPVPGSGAIGPRVAKTDPMPCRATAVRDQT